jgi:hypothetical protein
MFLRGNLDSLFKEVREFPFLTPGENQATTVPMDEEEIASQIEPEEVTQSTVKKAALLCRRGLFSKASNALNCAATAPPTDATFDKLRRLHD